MDAEDRAALAARGITEPIEGWYELLATFVRRFGASERDLRHFFRGLSGTQQRRMREDWPWQAHKGQRVPKGDWNCWLVMAGRGFGKTRAGAEWVQQQAISLPGPARIALVADTHDEAVRVMVQGPSGILATARTGFRPEWKQAQRRVDWPNGAQAFVYSTEAAEALRGPEHDAAWCDELGKWGRRGEAAWDNLMMGLRRGERPRVVVTTTPRAGALLKRIHDAKDTAVTRGATADNKHLPPAFLKAMQATYGGTRLGAQELDGRLIEAVEGSLFPPAMLEAARIAPFLFPCSPLFPGEGRGPDQRESAAGAADWTPAFAGELRRVVVGVDPPASATGDACGIVVCGLMGGEPPCHAVLADASVKGKSPDGWARVVAATAAAWGAERVVAEKNNGGEMVGTVLRGADCDLPIKLVHATRGKAARAEPVAALMEAGRVKLAGRFPELEEELSGLTAGGDYEGPSRSPDRADACVWAMWALIEGSRSRGPSVMGF